MLQSEFEERVGYRVTPEQYVDIEKMYLYCPNIDKDTFCKEYQKPGRTKVTLGMVQYCQTVEKQLNDAYEIGKRHNKVMKDQLLMFVEYLMDDMNLNGHEEHRSKCIAMIGERDYIRMKIERREGLSETDTKTVLELIKI